MNGQPLGEVGNGGLRTGVRRDLRERSVGVHAADVDDVAALAAHHLARERLRRDQRTQEVEVEHELHAGSVQVKEAFGVGVDVAFIVQIKAEVVAVRARTPGARAVHQNIAFAKVLFHGVRHFIADGLVQHVALVSPGNAALGGDLIREALRGFLVQVQQGDLRARAGQRFGKRAAQHAARAGDNGNFAGKIGIQYIFVHGNDAPFKIQMAGGMRPPGVLAESAKAAGFLRPIPQAPDNLLAQRAARPVRRFGGSASPAGPENIRRSRLICGPSRRLQTSR